MDFTIVQGTSTRYAGGVTTATGTSETKVTNPAARGSGRDSEERGPARATHGGAEAEA